MGVSEPDCPGARDAREDCMIAPIRDGPAEAVGRRPRYRNPLKVSASTYSVRIFDA